MRFTSDEITFLTAIVKGPDPFGIIIKRKHGDVAKKSAQNAKKALIEKGIIDDKGITKVGLAAVRLWDEYCNAKYYLIISGNIIGLLPDRRCVIIVKIRNEYEIVSGDRVEIINGLFNSTPELFRADSKTDSSVQLTSELNFDDFSDRLQSFGDKWFTLGYFPAGGLPGEENFVYWDENEFYMYDPHAHIQRIVSPSSIRKKIINYLDLNLENLKNGRQKRAKEG